jgi:hypothetical protein
VTSLKRISLLLLLSVCLAAAGCGSDDEEGAPIPADAATALERRLGETESRLANGSLGACEDILNDTMPEVGKLLDSLPTDVDADVRDALEQSFQNLWAIVESECEQRTPDEPAETAPEPEPEPEPEVTETETVPTETTPTETAPDPTDPEEAPLPEDGDGDSNGVIPEGNGGGGVAPGGDDE